MFEIGDKVNLKGGRSYPLAKFGGVHEILGKSIVTGWDVIEVQWVFEDNSTCRRRYYAYDLEKLKNGHPLTEIFKN